VQPEPEIHPLETLVIFKPVPPDLQDDIGTVEPRPRKCHPGFDGRNLKIADRGWDVIVAIALAAKNQRLLLTERKNRITGRWGLIVCDVDQPRMYYEPGRPLAELPASVPAQLDEEAKGRFNRMGWNAERSRSSLVIHKPFQGTWARASAFVCLLGKGQGDALRIQYHARLLLHDQEVAQWRT
jgi:hypothetical protein